MGSPRRAASSVFQSTRPSRGETFPALHRASAKTVFQSTRPSRGETSGPAQGQRENRISIHSPLAGRDCFGTGVGAGHPYFNPLAPRGARQRSRESVDRLHRFQSTRPSRGETWSTTGALKIAQTFQSTRPSRGETKVVHSWRRNGEHFNPLAPRGARLSFFAFSLHLCMIFQSTRPSRGETARRADRTSAGCISIHSPLAGRDRTRQQHRRHHRYFNPLAPRGARPWCVANCLRHRRFQSTRPSRGETCWWSAPGRRLHNFNPLAPRGARRKASREAAKNIRFQSTRPSRGETIKNQVSTRDLCISIHSPLAGRDRNMPRQPGNAPYFNPLAPRGARPDHFDFRSPRFFYFNPLAPRGARLSAQLFFFSVSLFQSTRPSRGETNTSVLLDPPMNFNPLAPRGARQQLFPKA